ncbi:hypothetical protein SAMN05428959_103522 [Duganella sp. CF517]|uniref:DUF5694 domain-containing protein n=1 Tax=Duganella sp. CF517 TaxID=1881038 RepID=UPI0008B25C63|nr:DUF5694 domain-containing protein [Duganella sp. CF517]SEN87051.1 hypothetical protein SAMN05428959_103522 [Duganella sp. CF517]
MHRLFAAIFVTAVCHLCAYAAEAPTPPFAPGAHKLQNGQANQLMVLGSPHLSQMSKSFDLAKLSLLNERLAEWQPQAIAIEEMSGLRCAFMRGYPQRYADTTKSYCWDPAVAKAATGLDVPEANAQVERLLAAWPVAPSPAERRKLAALFLAAGERASAVVQWLRLPAGERRAADGLPDSLVGLLNTFAQRRDESYQIGAALAARGGHDRVYPIDDQTAASPDGDMNAYAAAIGKAWDNPYTAARTRQSEEVESRLGTPAGVVAMYRAYNDAGAAEQTFRSDFGAALEEPSPQHFGRGYVGYWETRNLRMASNIRDVMTARPGMRVLVIVGASHKAYLEAYLDQMHDVRIVSTDRVLRAE